MQGDLVSSLQQLFNWLLGRVVMVRWIPVVGVRRPDRRGLLEANISSSQDFTQRTEVGLKMT